MIATTDATYQPDSATPTATAELHLFILWNKALDKAGEILTDMQRRFTIHRLYETHWSEKHFSSNLSRFYGQKLPPNSGKEQHCGRGPFLAALVIDREPQYEMRNTSRGPRVVNSKCFDAKKLYRDLTGGGHRIHATNSVEEANHDLVLLMNQSVDEFIQSNPDPWDGSLETLKRDLAGSEGWSNLAELFHALNAAIPYAVLRNFEGLPESGTSKDHGDIDLICSAARETAFVANAEPVFPDPTRVLYRARVAGQETLFDLRQAEDNYYDPRWAKDMLARRVLSPKGFYHLPEDDHFFSLLYHATVHKPTVSADYRTRLAAMSAGRNALTADSFDDAATLRSALDRYMNAHGYRFVEPGDLSVHFNAEFAQVKTLSVGRIFRKAASPAQAFSQLFRQAADCSSDSPEFQGQLFRTRGVARYFSRNRAMFLESLDLPRESSVLEIGAESGVLTRWLGERFRSVTALDANPELAELVRERCRDLQSVTVERSADAFDTARQFDLILALIARQAGGDGAAVKTLLHRARQLVSRNGLFVLGLDSSLPITDWRDEIVAQLKSLGFGVIRVAYPFPDAQLPRVVFSDRAIGEARKSFGYWAAFARKESDIVGTAEFETAAASAQGRLDAMATSCYILASRSAEGMPEIPWQACAISSESRHPSLRAATRVLGENAQMTVVKRGARREAGIFRFDPNIECPLYDGHTGSAALLYALRARDLGQFMTLLKAHAQFLLNTFAYPTRGSHAPLLTKGDVLLRGEALDAIPQNTALHDESFRAFDLEWSVSIPLPLSYMLYRGLYVLLLRIQPEVVCRAFQLQQHGVPERPAHHELCKFFVDALGIFAPLDLTAIHHMIAFEQRFGVFVGDGAIDPETPSLMELYHEVIARKDNADLEGARQALERLHATYPDAQ
jgi:hypothetical protein